MARLRKRRRRGRREHSAAGRADGARGWCFARAPDHMLLPACVPQPPCRPRGGAVGHHGGPRPISRRCGASCAGARARGTAPGLQPFLSVRSPVALVAPPHAGTAAHPVSPRDDSGRVLRTRCKATPLQTKPHGRLRMPSASKSSRMTVSHPSPSPACSTGSMAQTRTNVCSSASVSALRAHFKKRANDRVYYNLILLLPSVCCDPSRTASCRVLPRFSDASARGRL